MTYFIFMSFWKKGKGLGCDWQKGSLVWKDEGHGTCTGLETRGPSPLCASSALKALPLEDSRWAVTGQMQLVQGTVLLQFTCWFLVSRVLLWRTTKGCRKPDSMTRLIQQGSPWVPNRIPSPLPVDAPKELEKVSQEGPGFGTAFLVSNPNITAASD